MANLSDNKNVIKKLTLASLAIPKAYSFAVFAEAGHSVNSDIGNEKGKKRGACQVAYDAGGAGVRGMMIATGSTPEDVWYLTIDSSAITPAYTPAYPAPVVGVGSDLKPNYNKGANWSIASLPFPVVAAADLADLGHTVNYFEMSGKKEGTVVIVDQAPILVYAIATGNEPASPWFLSDGSVVTPAGTLKPSTSVEGWGDGKPVVDMVDDINSIDFPVFLLTDLADIGFSDLYNEQAARKGLNGATVIGTDGAGAYYLLYGIFADTASDFWADLSGQIANVTPA